MTPCPRTMSGLVKIIRICLHVRDFVESDLGQPAEPPRAKALSSLEVAARRAVDGRALTALAELRGLVDLSDPDHLKP